MNSIVFFDTASLYHASYWLTGLYACRTSHHYRFRISSIVPSVLAQALNSGHLEQSKFMCLFQSCQDGETTYFCIDTTDGNEYYHLPLLKFVNVYFKVNYNCEIIERTSNLRPYIEKIVPIQQFFPVRFPYALAFSSHALGPKPWRGFWRQTIHLKKRFLTLDGVIQNRAANKDVDVFFISTLRDKHQQISDFRFRIIKSLQQHQQINALTGLRNFNEFKQNAKYSNVAHSNLCFSAYVGQLARSKVVIYTRGMHNCISSRFALFMALGIPMIGQRIINNADYYYDSCHLNEQLIYEDVEEIAEKAVQLANDKAQCEHLSESNIASFNRLLSPPRVAERILKHIGFSIKDVNEGAVTSHQARLDKWTP